MTISKRVMLFLKKQPGTTNEIGKALGLKRRGWKGYNWGKWSFYDAEAAGLIEHKEGQWHLKKAEG